MNLGDRPQSMMGRTDDGASESWAFVNGSMPGCYVSSVVCDSLQPYRLQPTRLLCPWNFPGKNTRVGSHSLLQGIFPTQGLNLGLLHCMQILYHLSHQRSPRTLLEIFKKLPRWHSGRFDPWVRKIPWSRKWQPTPFLSEKFQGQRSLVGCSLWGHKESDMAEHTHTLIHTQSLR